MVLEWPTIRIGLAGPIRDPNESRQASDIALKLSTAEFEQLLRDVFTGERPLKIDPYDHGRQAIQWAEQVAKLEGVVMTYHPADKDPRCRTLCRFIIPDKTVASHRRSDELRVEYSASGSLLLKSSRGSHDALSCPISSLQEIARLVTRVRRRYVMLKAQEEKRNAVVHMKSRAILTAVQGFSQRYGFEFHSMIESEHVAITVLFPDQEPVERKIRYDSLSEQLVQFEQMVSPGPTHSGGSDSKGSSLD